MQSIVIFGDFKLLLQLWKRPFHASDNPQAGLRHL